MKTLIKLAMITAAVGFGSCKKDNNTIKIQAHDQNQMMGIMHQMMAKMDTLKLTKDPDNDLCTYDEDTSPGGN